jgi:hypothetical protein
MKTKPILLILATLIIGFILGMLTSAQIRSHRLNPVRVFFSEARFREGFYRTVQPDDQQKPKIDEVLSKYAKINSALQNNFRKELDASMQGFRKEIDSFLTKEQISRLKEMDERRQKMIPHNRRERENDTFDFRGDRGHFHEGRPTHVGPTPAQPGHELDTTDRDSGNK